MVSIVGRRAVRRLHHLALGGRLPGKDYKEYVLYGDTCPSANLYDVVCKQCWKEGLAPLEAVDQASLGEEDPPSSSGESSEELES